MSDAVNVSLKPVSPWLTPNAAEQAAARFDRDGFFLFENVLSAKELEEIQSALKPYLEADILGRNEFEGLRSNRVYAMLAKSPVFARLAAHPLALAFAERDLGADCLLSACLAINLQPGETAQPWHYDDSHYEWPRPRRSLGVSAFWAISDLTDDNGPTEFIQGSHLWGEENPNGAMDADVFRQDVEFVDAGDPAARADAVKATMPAGSLMLAKGTLWHRGGANRSDAPRLIITPQYCPGWTRQLENMALAVPPEIAATLPDRARELIGYSIHNPFMGYVDGRHPKRILSDD